MGTFKTNMFVKNRVEFDSGSELTFLMVLLICISNGFSWFIGE